MARKHDSRNFVPYSLVLSFLLTTILPAQTLKNSRPDAVGMSAKRLGQVDQVVREAIRQGKTPGAIVLVARQGKIVYEKAFGQRSLLPEPENMTLDTIFDMASLTKLMATATSIMILVEEGKVCLSDPVADYLPDFSQHGKGTITLLQLLTHYSGLRPDLDLDRPWNGYQTALKKAYQEKLVANPDETFIYSDINYLVLAEVLRQVTDQFLSQFAQERIFRPLGMKQTSFSPKGNGKPVSPTEFRDGEMIIGEVHDSTAHRMGGAAGHAGLFSTARDTAIFSQMILNGGIYDDVRILSPLSVLRMATPQSPPQASEWRGLGFDIRTPFSTTRGDLFPVGSFGHTGFTGTSLWIDPMSQAFVILLTNRLHPDGKGNVTALRRKVASVVAASILKLPSMWEHSYRSD